MILGKLPTYSCPVSFDDLDLEFKADEILFSYCSMLLLLLLSRFSRVQLSAAPWTAAYQAPLSMGYSRQEYWSGVPLPPLYCSIIALKYCVILCCSAKGISCIKKKKIFFLLKLPPSPPHPAPLGHLRALC